MATLGMELIYNASVQGAYMIYYYYVVESEWSAVTTARPTLCM